MLKLLYYLFLILLALAVIWILGYLALRFRTRRLNKELRESQSECEILRDANRALRNAEPEKIQELRRANEAHQELLDAIMAELARPVGALDLASKPERIANLIEARRPDHV